MERSAIPAFRCVRTNKKTAGLTPQPTITKQLQHLTASRSKCKVSSVANSSMLHVRVDDETKAKAAEALASMGLSISDAVRILLKRVVNDQAFPLELKVPNAETRAAMNEARGIAESSRR